MLVNTIFKQENPMTATYLPGKDDSLENAIARMQDALARHGFRIVEHTWANPAPNIWWVHIRDADNPMCFTNGKGATQLAARASALGELIERLSCNYFFADYYLGADIASGDFVHYPNEKWFAVGDGTLAENCPDGLLTAELTCFYDPDAELPLRELYDMNSGISERGLCAIPFTRQSDDQTVYFPVNIVGNLYVSNGMSAGSTKVEARTQALSEVFERWVKNRIIAEGIALPLLPETVLARYPTVAAGIADMRSHGYVVQVFDASLGGRFPVIGAALLNPADNGCLTSFGAHPDFAVALERTITELLQGRELNDLGQFPAPTFDNDWVSDAHNLETHFIDSTGLVSWDLFRSDKDYDFADWDFSDNTAREYEFLLDLLHQLGAEVYVADYDYLGVYACRVLVPGYSEIYPVEELTQYNNNIGNSVRESILQLPDRADAAVCERILQWLDDSGLDDSERLSQVLGLSIEADNPWHSVRLGELRCYACLGTGDFDGALEMVEWLTTFASNTLPDDRRRFFACLHTLLQIQADDTRHAESYADIHRQLFGNGIYDAAIAHLKGQANGYGLPSEDLSLSGFANHQRWLARYRVWQGVKI